MRALTIGLCAVGITATVMLGATTAHADRNDLTLERIVGMPTMPGAFNDPTDPVRQTMYKSLMSELALHEGFHDWAIPSFAVRGAVSHLLGASQVDLTTISIDATLSKSFGIGGTVTLDPYAGAAVLLSFVRGQVIDTTPNTDAFADG